MTDKQKTAIAKLILQTLNRERFAQWYNRGPFDDYITGELNAPSEETILENIIQFFQVEKIIQMIIQEATPQIAATPQIDPALMEKIIHGIMDNYPEAGASNTLMCTNWDYKNLKFTFFDSETRNTYEVTKDMLIRSFSLLFTDKWPKGLTQPPAITEAMDENTWDDWVCLADAGDFDAFVQLAIFGEVIYG